MKFKAQALWGVATLALMSAAPAMAQDVSACLITKTDTNPFFVKMKEGAEAAATAAGLDFQAYAGVKDGDAAPQITAIENCVAAGAKGILITASNDSVGPALKEARAAGILVIALDTPLADAEAQDMTFATDNFEAGLRIGKWAAAKLGAEAANAKIAMLDINKDNISVDVARDTGFLKGFDVSAKGTPIGMTTAEFLAEFAPNLGAQITGANLVLTGTGVALTLYDAQLDADGMQEFGPDKPLVSELTWNALGNSTSGNKPPFLIAAA